MKNVVSCVRMKKATILSRVGVHHSFLFLNSIKIHWLGNGKGGEQLMELLHSTVSLLVELGKAFLVAFAVSIATYLGNQMMIAKKVRAKNKRRRNHPRCRQKHKGGSSRKH